MISAPRQLAHQIKTSLNDDDRYFIRSSPSTPVFHSGLSREKVLSESLGDSEPMIESHRLVYMLAVWGLGVDGIHASVVFSSNNEEGLVRMGRGPLVGSPVRD